MPHFQRSTDAQRRLGGLIGVVDVSILINDKERVLERVQRAHPQSRL